MTNKIDFAKSGAARAELMITILHDALEEAAKFMRTLDNDVADSMIEEWERRELIERGRASAITLHSTPDRLVAWLSASEPQAPYVRGEWDRLTVARVEMVSLVAANPDKTAQAIVRPGLRAWFAGQIAANLTNQRPSPRATHDIVYTDLLGLVAEAFKVVAP